MSKRSNLTSVKHLFHRVDWALFLFLLLFLDVKLVVKVAAIAGMYLIRPTTKFDVGRKHNRLPIFYLLMITIAIVDGLIYQGFSSLSNTISIATGLGFWLLCFLAIHQLKLATERNEVGVLHNTLLLFFAVNILFSFLNIARIMVEIGEVNPYRYQGDYQKYFIGTGDYVKGITFDTSTTNAVINAFAVVYFLKRENAIWVILSMAAMLLTASNFTNLILVCTLGLIFFFGGSKAEKSLIIVCSSMLVIFLVKVSPQNDKYVTGRVNKFLFNNQPAVAYSASLLPITLRDDATLSSDERMEKVAQLYLDSLSRVEAKDMKVALMESERTKPVIPVPSIHSRPFQRKRDPSELQWQLLSFAKTNQLDLEPADPERNSKWHPGKIEGALQTINFFKSHPTRMIGGNGMGNFSSKLAFRTTALNIAGGYPLKYRYINQDFKNNHLSLFLSYFTGDMENHSIINTPNSTYDQIFSEYGLLGLSAFFTFYIGFFVASFKKLTYGIPLLLMMSGLFFVEYWFEQLSVVILFELLMLLNMKECKPSIKVSNGQ